MCVLLVSCIIYSGSRVVLVLLVFYVLEDSLFLKHICSVNPDHFAVMSSISVWVQGYITFFMLDSYEHKIYPARKC